MTTRTITSFRIHALPASLLERVRQTGVDVSGTPVAPSIANGGEPLRCCLRNARPGEGCLLFGYEPVIPSSPYREIGAVYAHAEPCSGPVTDVEYPSDWHGRPQVLRAYDARGWIHDASRVHDGTDPEAVIAEMLSDPTVEQIHSRNIAWGCYMFAVTR